MDQPQRRFVALDGLRGFAAVIVVLSHCGHHLRMPWLVGHGGFAVDVFFAMSGFVLHRTYGPRLRGGWSVRDFALARFVRLYPLYAAGLLLGLAVMSAAACRNASPGAVPLLLRAFLDGALLIPDLSDPAGQIFPLDAPSWSLLVEAVVGIGYAVCAGRVRGTGLAILIGLSAAGLAGAALWGVPLLAAGLAATLGVSLLRGVFGFATGVAIACAEERGLLRPLARFPAWLAFAFLGACALLPEARFGLAFDLLGILVAAPVIVSLGVAGRLPSCAGRACLLGGLLSYPLYTLHAPLLFWVAQIELPRWTCPPGLALGVLLATTFACAGLALGIGLRVEPRLIGALRRAIGALSPSRDGVPEPVRLSLKRSFNSSL